MKISEFFSRPKEGSSEQSNLPDMSITDQKVYESLFNNNIDLTFILDRDGTILNVNEATEANTGFSKDEMIGNSFLPFVTEEDIATSMKLFEKVLKGKTQNAVFSLKTKDREGNHGQLHYHPD